MLSTNKKTGFFEEEYCVKSSMRLMSFMVFWLHTLVDIFIYLYLTKGYYKDHPLDMWIVILIIFLNLLFLVSEFYPKYLQKIIELGADKIDTFKKALAPIKPSDISSDIENKIN